MLTEPYSETDSRGEQRYGWRGAGISVSSEQPSASSGALKFVCGLLNASKHVFNG